MTSKSSDSPDDVIKWTYPREKNNNKAKTADDELFVTSANGDYMKCATDIEYDDILTSV